MKIKTLETEVNDAINFWGIDKHTDFLEDILHILEIYGFQTKEWIDLPMEEEQITVRLIETIYMISKIADKHAGALASFKMTFPKLHERMEKIVAESNQHFNVKIVMKSLKLIEMNR